MSKSAGSLFGLAYGDAMGAPTEFKSIEQINRMYGPEGPLTLPMSGSVSHVTDDTQMALAVADALAATLEGGNALIPDRFEPRVRHRFMQWWRSPDNDRAPGNTCMQACEAMASGTPWLQATIIGSKGCGANMRVTPLALPSGLDLDDRCGAAQLQAAMTHGHPTGVAASELTMAATLLALTEPLAGLPAALRSWAHDHRAVYHQRWLGDLWKGPYATTPQDWIARGWDECLAALDRLDAALASPDRDADPCVATGAGWIAEEALATALQCVLLYPDDPVAALSRAAVTSGDSDSIAALAGAIIGAAYGMDAWPAEWATQIEYADELSKFAELWA
jgi:ADP-ribosylglycohydrolase